MLKQTDAARMIGISYSTLQNNEAGQYPNQNNLQKSINFYKCSKDWLLTGQEPVYQNPDEFTETVGINRDKKNYDNYDNIAGPGVGHKVDRDGFGKAVSGLKEIFDSDDPVFITAIQANIHALRTSVRIEAHTHEQTKEINNLKKECDDLKFCISSLETRLMEGDRRIRARRQKDLGPPDGVERRSVLDRREKIKTPLNTQGQMLEDRK